MVPRFAFALPFLLWCDGHRWFNSTALAGFRLRRQKRCFRYLTKVFPALFLLSLALPASAQNEIVTVTNWRVQQGDNPLLHKRTGVPGKLCTRRNETNWCGRSVEWGLA
jgi:hypothetical protein